MKTNAEGDRSRLSEKIAHELRDKILRGELPWGSKLFLEETAQQLGVSKTPVIHALTLLATEGLVDVVPRRGAFVRKFGEEEVLEVYSIREHLEGLAASEASQRASTEDLVRLRDIFAGFREPLNQADYESYRKANWSFHRQVVALSKNTILIRLYDSSSILFRSHRWGDLIAPRLAIREHMKIISAIASHDARRAEMEARRHVRNSRDRFAATMERRRFKS